MLSPLGLPPPCSRPSNRMSSAQSLPQINHMTSKMTSSMDRSSADWPTFDDILHRFRNSPHSIPQPHSNPKAQMAPLEIPSPQRLGPAFELNPPTPLSSTSSRYLNNVHDHSVIDIFAPKMSLPDLSPSSSSSSDYGVGSNTPFTNGNLSGRWSLHEAFAITCSRVILLHVAPPASVSSIFALFSSLDCNPSSISGGSAPVPMSMWTVRGEPRREPEDVWAVFRCHDDACAALSLFHPFISIVPALESDLEPFDKLRPLEVSPMHASSSPALSRAHPQHHLRMSFSTPDLQRRAQAGMPGMIHGSIAAQKEDFVISSNPPNPRTTFRLGDWICNAPNCAAHNFGRNLACRGCGCPRAEYPLPSMQTCVAQAARLPSSPRFVGATNPPKTYSLPPPNGTTSSNSRPSSVSQPIVGIAKSPSPTQPLLTPSGRAFSVGGKVQNISTDPYAPCVMYWPDNEPIPEQGQIRPSGLAAAPQPPILNTGNRGPIEHQPGDWICLKCNYLNWRRRKVCQTCYPYAEGNGDSISAAVQAERISLLTSLLSRDQTPSAGSNMSASARVPRSHSMTPPQRHRMFQDMVTKQTPSSQYRSRSHIDLGAQYAESQFIYETPGPNKSSSFPSLSNFEAHLPSDTSASLLPSFLQDIVQSPTLSPTSTSSADLSIEEYEDSFPSPPRSLYGREQHLITSNDSSSNLPIGNNIWRLNGEESKGLSGIALPNQEDLLGGSRRSSREMLRYQVVSS